MLRCTLTSSPDPHMPCPPHTRRRAHGRRMPTSIQIWGAALFRSEVVYSTVYHYGPEAYPGAESAYTAPGRTTTLLQRATESSGVPARAVRRDCRPRSTYCRGPLKPRPRSEGFDQNGNSFWVFSSVNPTSGIQLCEWCPKVLLSCERPAGPTGLAPFMQTPPRIHGRPLHACIARDRYVPECPDVLPCAPS